MDQPALSENALDPKTLHYDLRADQPFSCFNGAEVTVLPLTLSVGKGAPLDMHGVGPDPLRIGARIHVNDGTAEEPARGAFVGEYRADSTPFTAHKGLHYTRSMTIGIPRGAPSELILDIDLVKENHFWGSDLGHRPFTMVLTQRRVAFRPGQSDPLDMTETLMHLHDFRAREARYEAVIFSLLNQLSKRDA
jgi:hypothetical protein